MGPLSRGHRAHVGDIDLSRDHFVAQGSHDRRDKRKAILALVGDQDPQVIGVAKLIRHVGDQSLCGFPAVGQRPIAEARPADYQWDGGQLHQAMQGKEK